jgi:hypothetical protein
MVLRQSADVDCTAHEHLYLFIAEWTIQETINVWTSNVSVKSSGFSSPLCYTQMMAGGSVKTQLFA